MYSCGQIWTLTRQVHICIIAIFISSVVYAQVRYSIPEEMVKGSLIGDISKDLGLNNRRLVSGRARIVTEDENQSIELNTDKGVLLVKRRIDREELCGQISPCSFDFEVVLENPMELFRVTVEILDINDNAPVFPKKEIVLDIVESAVLGAHFMLGSAVDPDVGINTLQSYSLKPTQNFNLKEQTHPDGSKYVEMVLQTPLDREKQEQLSLTLTAVDGGNPQRSGTVNILINVLDANDNAPVFSQAVYKASVLENSPKGTLVITVSATDADKGTNGQITYYMNHITDRNGNLFTVNPDSGEIKVSGLVDFEKDKHYQLNIVAKDQGGLTNSCKVILDVTDVNDNAPVIALTSLSSTVSEDSMPGTTVAIINVKDLDSGKNGQVNCSINRSVPFKIRSSLTNYYTLVTDQILDREAVSEYNITVTAADNGTPALYNNKTLLIRISDVNDNAPRFDQGLYTSHITENNTPGVSIASIHAKDADWNQNARVSYFLEESLINGSSVSSFISVNSETGVIYAVRSFDYEQLKYFEIRLKAQDGGSPPLSSSVTVKIFVQDQNDNSPQILYPVQSGVSLVAEMVARSADVGYLVTKVVAVDADSGQNAWLSYKLLKATDRALFEVGSQNGEIRTSRQVSDKDAVKQRLVVVVEDNGQPSRSATVNVNVAVADSFPEVLSEFSDFTHDKDYNDSLTFYLVLSLAVVSFLFIVSVIVLVSVKVYRWRQSRLFYKSNGNLPVIPSAYYPPRYADVGAAGTLQHVYNYEVCMTTDSRKSDIKYVRPCSVINVDPGATDTIQKEKSVNEDKDIISGQVRYSIPEEMKKGSFVGNVAQDLGLDIQRMVSGRARIVGSGSSHHIELNVNRGSLIVREKIDREQLCGKIAPCTFSFEVVLENPMELNVTLKIYIQDQNDNSPQILYPVQSGVSLVAEMVARSADVGYLVTKVVAVDADSGQNAWLSYKLLKATDRALFEVGSQNGEIRTSRQVSDKDAVKQRLVVVVEDNGQPSRSATVNVNVAVADSFPEVLSEFSDFTHDKDYNDSLTFYLVLSLAVVSFLFIVSVIVLVSVKVYRWRQSRLFYKSNGNLPVIPSAYYPPRYADVGATGTLQHVYNYEVCMTTDSGKSEYRYIRPVSQNLVNVDPNGTETMPHAEKEKNVADDSGSSMSIYLR
ncbi:protocadherin beta-15-like [Amia ocellicauda]|uniref:protocadherin beta-15-like n=1 Tax=Amia ocellicauda TaxID=2972642 RepID=UPI003463ECF5